MATVVAAPRAAARTVTPAPGPRRVSTPAALSGLLAVVALLCVVTGILGAVVASRSAASARTLTAQTVPAELAAATVTTSLAEADETAADGFLAGGLEPAADRATYRADIDAVGRNIAVAGTHADARAAADIAVISAQLPVYAGLVETAVANNRQGFPVGAAYLSTASNLLSPTTGAGTRAPLPAAQDLLSDEQERVDAGFTDARSSGTTALVFLALVLLGGTLLVTQLLLVRRTRRLVNLPLAVATLLILGALVATAAVVGVARSRFDDGSRKGSAPIAQLTTAETDAHNEKGDESLTLVGRGDDSHEPQFKTTSAALTTTLRQAADGAPSVAARHILDDAQVRQEAFVANHATVTGKTDAGDFDGSAAAQAAGNAPFRMLISDLDRVRNDNRGAFDAAVSSTTNPLDALAVVDPVLCALALLLAAVGIRLRLREFR